MKAQANSNISNNQPQNTANTEHVRPSNKRALNSDRSPSEETVNKTATKSRVKKTCTVLDNNSVIQVANIANDKKSKTKEVNKTGDNRISDTVEIITNKRGRKPKVVNEKYTKAKPLPENKPVTRQQKKVLTQSKIRLVQEQLTSNNEQQTENDSVLLNELNRTQFYNLAELNVENNEESNNVEMKENNTDIANNPIASNPEEDVGDINQGPMRIIGKTDESENGLLNKLEQEQDSWSTTDSSLINDQ
ncbi:hypothetical protein BpHYR1_001095, partial [Brachionus plicatilis]